jgi:hypothetical protein
MTTEKVFHADDKYVLRLLNVVIHEHQFKRKGKYYKFHFDKETAFQMGFLLTTLLLIIVPVSIVIGR